MPELNDDGLAWKPAGTGGKSMLKSFTDAELVLLHSYPRLSTCEIASTLGVSMRAVYDWLIILGIPRNHVRHQALMSTQNNPRFCSECGIILAAASRMDGHGSNGLCLYCHLQKQGIRLYPRSAQPDGQDSWERAIEAYGMAAGRDDR